MASVLAAAAVLPAFAAAELPLERVIGGANADPQQAPWMVSLHRTGSSPWDQVTGHFCAAVLIHPEYLIGSAHCVDDYIGAPSSISATAGRAQLSTDAGETRAISAITLHPSYSSVSFAFDVAILKLSAPIEGIPPLRLIPPGVGLAEVQGSGSVFGWGVSDTGIAASTQLTDSLQQASVPIPPETTCTNAMQPYFQPGNMMCAGKLASAPGAADGIDTCIGDSGGPLLAALSYGVSRAVAISSWGYDCASYRYYGVYSRLDAVSEWIWQNVPLVPLPLSNPIVTGEAKVGSLLSCANTAWEGLNPQYSYAWEEATGGTQVAAGQSTYTPVSADAGKQLRCTVTATSGAGSSSASSELTAAVIFDTTTTTSTTTTTTTIPVRREKSPPELLRMRARCRSLQCTLLVTATDPGRKASGVNRVEVRGGLKARLCDAEGRNCRPRSIQLTFTDGPVSGKKHRFIFQIPAPGSLRLRARAVDNAGNRSRLMVLRKEVQQ